MKRSPAIVQHPFFATNGHGKFAFYLHVAGSGGLPIEPLRRAWRSTTYRQVQKLDQEIAQCLPESQ